MLTLKNTPCICYCFWVTVVLLSCSRCDSSSSSSAGLQKAAISADIWARSEHDARVCCWQAPLPVLICLHCCRAAQKKSRRLCRLVQAICVCFWIPSTFSRIAKSPPPVLPASCKPHFICFRGSSKWQWHLITPATGRKWEKVQLIYGATRFVIKYPAFVPAWDTGERSTWSILLIHSFIYALLADTYFR